MSRKAVSAKNRKIHLLLTTGATACGRPLTDPAVAGFVSPDPDDVTCHSCQEES